MNKAVLLIGPMCLALAACHDDAPIQCVPANAPWDQKSGRYGVGDGRVVVINRQKDKSVAAGTLIPIKLSGGAAGYKNVYTIKLPVALAPFGSDGEAVYTTKFVFPGNWNECHTTDEYDGYFVWVQ